MKIDYKKPIVSSLLSMGITFVITIIMLYIVQPVYIIEVSDDGKKKRNVYLLFTYSLLFSVFIGIIVLLFRTGHKDSYVKMGFNNFNPKSFKPQIYSPKQ